MMEQNEPLKKLLIIDDNDDIRRQLKWGLGQEFKVLLAADGKEALSVFRRHMPPVVTLDLGLPPHEEDTEEGFRCLSEMLQLAAARSGLPSALKSATAKDWG